MSVIAKCIVAAFAAVAVVNLACADDLKSTNRVELKRADLSAPGANMEVIMSTTEYPPGTPLPRHIHHGDEALYVLQGATIETPDGKQMRLKPEQPRSIGETCHTAGAKSSATRR